LGPKIALRFAAVIAPLAILAVVAGRTRCEHGTRMAQTFPRHLAASDARKDYKTFVDGLADGLDTGKLSAAAVLALNRAQESLHKISAGADADSTVAALEHDLAQLAATAAAPTAMQLLLPMRDTVGGPTRRSPHLTRSSRHRRRPSSARHWSTQKSSDRVVITTCLVLALAALFVRGMIRRLTAPCIKAFDWHRRLPVATSRCSPTRRATTKPPGFCAHWATWRVVAAARDADARKHIAHRHRVE